MSLRVWLPLDGSLENKGISNITANVQSGVVVDNNGKIGKCYTNSGTSVNVAIPFSFITKQFSLCAWVKINTRRNNWCRAFGLSGTGNYIGLGCEHTNGTGFGFHFYKTINGTNTSVFDTYPLTFSTGTWVHFLMAYDGTKYYIYKNGALIASANANQTNIEANMNTLYLFGGTANSYSLCSLNDVRIYDHCLSAAEVKEIAQGLILHYKLDSFQGGYGNPNIIVTHSNAGVDGTGTSGWSAAGTGWSNSFVSATGATGGYAIRCTYANTSQTSGGIHHSTGVDKTTLTTGDIYTLSARIRTSKACVVTFQNELMTTGHSINATTEWQIYTYTCAIDTSKTYQSNVMYVRAADAVQNMWIECDWIKLEKGTAATPWQPSGVVGTAIQDSSGYGHNGTILNTITLSSDTPRYSASTNLTAGNSMINCGRGAMVTDSLTVNLWIKYSTWGNPISCTEGGGWNFENSSGIQFPVYIASVGYKVANAGALPSANTWHMITGTYNRLEQTVNIYIDGELKKSTATGSSKLIGYHGSNVIWIGAEATGSNTTANNGMIGLVSDARIYCTALSAADVKQLYEIGAKVDNLGSIHTFEFTENGSNKIYKTGITQGREISEINGMSNLKYDPKVYIEPDGSAWVRIFHHNNPTSYKFASNDTFTTGVYKDENRWFNFDLCNYVDKWEFIVKSKTTPDATEYKYRWSQTKNPLTAAFADVASSAVTKNTTTGYTSYSWGGLYKINSSTFLCTNNGTNGNWWGAVGAWNAHQGGIPGWTTVITTGYEDVYLRIDNVTTTMPPIAKSTKNNIWVGHTLIEK